MNEKQLTEYAKQIHQTAKDKGWWDKKRNHDEIFMLIITELAEAVEADREDIYADYEVHDDIKDKVESMDEKLFKGYFEEWIKDTVEDELADTLIRALDYLYYRHRDSIIVNSMEFTFSDNFAEGVFSICKLFADRQILPGVIAITQFAERWGIDLQWHVEQKMRFNGMREYKHGGKKY